MRFYSVGLILLAFSNQALAQEARSTGLPKKVQWTFNFDAGLGSFGFAHSLYTNVKPDPSGDLSDNWIESYAKPALTATWRNGKKGGQFFGKISAVGERTYDAPPPIVGSEASSFMIEDLYIGWRSGTAIGAGEDALTLTFGRAQYKIGHGLLLWDGGGEGGTRGGFWSNARKAWALAGVARFHAKKNTLEGFYLDRNEVPEAETGTRATGANYERTLGEATTLGASFMHFMSDSNPARDGMNVYNLRAFTAPLKKLPNLSFEAEYALEDNGDLRSSTAYNVLAAYELKKVSWTPRISYRYAFFQGDDPATTKNESFDMLLPGFYDWGTWWQGEIGGEYFLANSNLISHQLRVHVKPSGSVSGGLIGYAFKLDQLVPPLVTSKDVATELDAYTDWSVNSNFIVSFVAAYAHPQTAATQAYSRSSNFTYGMIYVAYAY
jgi:hypothetical protein